MKLEDLLNWNDTKYPSYVTAWWSYKLHYVMKDVGFYSSKEWKRIEKELPLFIQACDNEISLVELRRKTEEASSCPSALTYSLCLFLKKEGIKEVHNLLDLEE